MDKGFIFNAITGELTEAETADVLIELTVEERTELYRAEVSNMVRNVYSEDDELAIHRKMIAGLDTTKFDIYNTFVEECKKTAKVKYGII